MKTKELIKSVGLTIALVALFILPDYLYMTVNPEYKIRWTFLIMKFLVPLSLGLVLCKNKWIMLSTLILLFAIQMMQFSRLDYFGRHLTPSDFVAMIEEWRDITLGAGDAVSTHWKIIPVVVLPFIATFGILKIKVKKIIVGDLLLILTLISIVIANCMYRCVPYPLENRISIDNSLKSFSIFVLDIFRNYKTPKYLPYNIKNLGIQTKEPITIVYIMGESSSAEHMSLFGYDRNTTPKLKELSKEKNFYYTEGIANAVCTNASSKFMANVIWEPNNTALTSSCETSLCKLAKENGFKVFYFAAKYDKMLNSVCNMQEKYIDEIKTRSDNDAYVTPLLDDYMIELINSRHFTGRNLIFLHQRCIHTPYQKAFPDSFSDRNHFKGKSERIDAYDNAMLYNDKFISAVFDKFNKQKNGKFYIIFASDHNELHGEEGIFGHAVLHPKVADIPVIVQSNDKEFMKKFKSIFKPTHYEIAKMIAEVLGFEIHNPNQKKNVFYINGLDYDGRGGYMELTKHPETKTVTYVTHYRKFKNEPRK